MSFWHRKEPCIPKMALSAGDRFLISIHLKQALSLQIELIDEQAGVKKLFPDRSIFAFHLSGLKTGSIAPYLLLLY